jgi:hypothetical protein
MTTLTYPLTKKALRAAFEPLQPTDIQVTRKESWNDAVVDGSWSLTKLRAHFRALGFKPTGKPDDLLFVNEAGTVGLQMQGAQIHPTKNTWKTYYVEVQARPLPRTARQRAIATSRYLWATLFGL